MFTRGRINSVVMSKQSLIGNTGFATALRHSRARLSSVPSKFVEKYNQNIIFKTSGIRQPIIKLHTFRGEA